MLTARSKAQLALRVQSAAIALFAAAMVPAVMLLLHAGVVATSLAAGQVTGEFAGTCLGLVLALVVQVRVARSGCFGVCAFPAVASVWPPARLAVRLVVQLALGCATLVTALALLHRLEPHLGLALGLGLFSLGLSASSLVRITFGNEGAVPRGLRFLFVTDALRNALRLPRTVRPAERSCVEALRDGGLPLADRLLAAELIAQRPRATGGMGVIREMAEDPNAVPELRRRCLEVLGQTEAEPLDRVASG